MNSEDLKGWIQCLSYRKFLVNLLIATKQGEIKVTVVLMSKMLQASHFAIGPASSWRRTFQTLPESAKTFSTILAGLKDSTVNHAEGVKGNLGYKVVSANT